MTGEMTLPRLTGCSSALHCRDERRADPRGRAVKRLLVDFDFDTRVMARAEFFPQRRGKTVACAAVRGIALYAEAWKRHLQICLHTAHNASLQSRNGIVQEADVDIPDPPVQNRGKRVNGKMKDPLLFVQALVYQANYPFTIGPVERADQLLFYRCGQSSAEAGKQVLVCQQTVLVDKQPCFGRGKQRDVEGAGEGTGYRQRTDIICFVGMEDGAMIFEQVAETGRYPVAGMFTGENKRYG
jgi:hypothetical protein